MISAYGKIEIEDYVVIKEGAWVTPWGECLAFGLGSGHDVMRHGIQPMTGSALSRESAGDFLPLPLSSFKFFLPLSLSSPQPLK